MSADASVAGAQFEPPRATVDGERLLAVFTNLVDIAGSVLPTSSEVVLHDLSRLPDSVVAVRGDVTGTRVGDTASETLLSLVTDDRAEDRLIYESALPDGRHVKSSIMIIRDVSGQKVAAFCMTFDISAWLEVKRLSEAMIGEAVLATQLPVVASEQRGRAKSASAPKAAPKSSAKAQSAEAPAAEEPIRDVDELARLLVRDAIASVGRPVQRMKKDQKLRVVEILQGKGFFTLKTAIEMVANELGVTRFTIYNYLNELGDYADIDRVGPPQT